MSAQNKYKLYFLGAAFQTYNDRIHTDEVYMYTARLIVGMLIDYFTCIHCFENRCFRNDCADF